MRTRDTAIRGVAFNWMGQLCSLLITFFLTPFLVHSLGKESYGIWSIVMGLTGYYAIADIGMRGTATKYIAQYDAIGDSRGIRRVITTLVAGYILLASIVVLAALLIGWLFPSIFETAGETRAAIRIVVALTALAFAVQLIGQPFGAALTAKTRFDVTNTLNVSVQLLLAVSMVFVLKAGWGLLGMAAATLAAGVLKQSVQYCLARHFFGSGLLAPKLFDLATVRELASFTSGIFVISAGRRLRDNAGVVVVGAILGPAAAAFFSIGWSLVQKMGTLVKGISRVVLPVASRLAAQGRVGELRGVAMLIPRVMTSLSLTIAVVVVVDGRLLIEYWIGQEYAAYAYPVMCILAVKLVATSLSGGHTSILTGQGRIRFLAWLTSIDTLLTYVLGACLVLAFGVSGMALALLGIQGIAYSVLLPIYTCRTMGCSWSEFMVRTVLPSVLANLPVLVVALALQRFVTPPNLWSLIGEILVVGAVAGVSIFLVCLPADVRTSVLQSLSWARRQPSTAETRSPSGD